jgi:hypothetical protein
MRRFQLLSFVLMYVLDCVLLNAQSSVSTVASSEAQDVVPAFSSTGPITLPVVSLTIDVSPLQGKKERGQLLVVHDPQGGHHFWRYSASNSTNDTKSLLSGFKSGTSAIYVAPDRILEFTHAIGVIEHRDQSNSIGNAENVAISDIQRSYPAGMQFMAGLKTVPLNNAPALVGYKGPDTRTKALASFTPIPLEFWCVPYGGPGQGPCPHGTLIVSISQQGDNWRLVLRNRWDEEVILDSNFNAVSSRQLTAPPK